MMTKFEHKIGNMLFYLNIAVTIFVVGVNKVARPPRLNPE